MRKSLKHLTILASMSLLLVGCNEKISAELESGNSTTLPPVITPTEYSFKITNESSSLLNYKLHRTGGGRYGTPNWECGITTTTKFDDNLFTAEASLPHDSKIYDVSCFLEAQEEDLYYHGIDLQVHASPNTCEYVAYAPFSYYERMPGSTSANFRGIICNDETITSAHLNDNVNYPGIYSQVPTYNGGIKIGCNQMVDLNTPEPLRVPQTITDNDQQFCRFDYLSVNCDSGSISYQLSEVYDARAEETDPVLPAIKSVPKDTHFCGGTTAACVGGPIREISELNSQTSGAESKYVAPNTSYQKVYEIPAPRTLEPNSIGNKSIANFRKGLANRDLNFIDYTTLPSVNWYDPTNGKSYDPKVMENYAANIDPSGTKIVATLPLPLDATALIPYSQYEAFAYSAGYKATPIAADAFMGLSSGARVNPFYTFYCLDEGREVKARIRLAVRDWDRVFPSNQTLFEEISDTFRADTDRRMDSPIDGNQIPGDPGYWLGYNDYLDWDDLIPMTRTNVFPYAPGVIWEPESGYFSYSNFPK